MQITDFEDKKFLRSYLKDQRSRLDKKVKENADCLIFSRFLNLDEINLATNVLTYVSCGFEVDTLQIISALLSQGKTLFSPVCKSGGIMDFYNFNSLSELVPAKMGLLEPDAKKSSLFDISSSAVCITPALGFDQRGFRIGYGGGYYDRFFAKSKDILKIGLCYDDFLFDKLITDDYDLPVDIIITETQTVKLHS